MAESQSTLVGSRVKPILLTETRRAEVLGLLATRVAEEIIVPELGPCHIWQGAKNPAGYGQIGVGGGKHAKAHRLAFVIAHGHTDLHVCHRCDQPSCVRVAHLFAGTKYDNMRDCAAKGRTVYQRRPELAPYGDRHPSKRKPGCIRRGEQCSQSKLTDAQAQEIRERYRAGGVTQATIAAEYGVKQCTISAIVLDKIYVSGLGNEKLDQEPV